MILTRTPFRVSFVGGSTDLPFFYKKCPGAVISTTIDRYMYIFIHEFFEEKIQLKYSKVELVDSADKLEHPIARSVLERMFTLYGKLNLDINSISDVPKGTGLGSSSAYTVGLLNALYAYYGKLVTKDDLAEEACNIEINKVGSPIGKQDQYASAFGGINFIEFFDDETVRVTPFAWTSEGRKLLEEVMMFFYVGMTRDANVILKDLQTEDNKFNSLIKFASLAYQFRNALTMADIESCGKLLHEGWALKKETCSSISNSQIDAYYDLAMNAGAYGGKLLGAGSGGFLLFLVPITQQDAVRKALSDLREVKFLMERHGSTVMKFGF